MLYSSEKTQTILNKLRSKHGTFSLTPLFFLSKKKKGKKNPTAEIEEINTCKIVKVVV